MPNLMPEIANPPTRPDGTPYTEADPQYWELAGAKGGIRRYVYQPYPKMLYRAYTGQTGRIEIEQTTAQTAKHHEQLTGEGWQTTEDAAKSVENARLDAIAVAAAEAEASARRLSEQAQAEWRKADAVSDGHLVDVPVKRGPGRPRKSPVTE